MCLSLFPDNINVHEKQILNLTPVLETPLLHSLTQPVDTFNLLFNPVLLSLFGSWNLN